MNQYNYKEKDVPKMLFTELVIASVINENKIFYNEIVKRLKFCGFEDEMITQLITYELEIIKTTKKTFNELFIFKKWWLNDTDFSLPILSLPLEKYLLYYNGNMSEDALTNSEIISLYDEANFIIANNLDLSREIINECQILSDEKSKQNLKNEFIHRIDYIYERELNIKYNQEIYKKIMKFFINESHILFLNKYSYKNKDQIIWMPYTNEFYKYYDY